MIKSAYVMGVVRNHFYHPAKEITPRKIIFKLLLNSGHLDKNNDVKHNMFRCLIPLIWMILVWRTEILCNS